MRAQSCTIKRNYGIADAEIRLPDYNKRLIRLCAQV